MQNIQRITSNHHAKRQAIFSAWKKQLCENYSHLYPDMKKASVIATCLTNSSMVNDEATGEKIVQKFFSEKYSEKEFKNWNTMIDGKRATQIIHSVGRAMHINVLLFIDDLS